MDTKPTNPKDSVGIAKAPFSTVSAPVMLEVGLAMMEGARKYGRHNYRAVGVRASVYYDAVMRHMFAWWEGEDTDPDSGLSHVTKAMAGLAVLRDSMMRGNWNDDRPPKCTDGWVAALNERAKELLVKYPDSVEAVIDHQKTFIEKPRFKPEPQGGDFPLGTPDTYRVISRSGHVLGEFLNRGAANDHMCRCGNGKFVIDDKGEIVARVK